MLADNEGAPIAVDTTSHVQFILPKRKDRVNPGVNQVIKFNARTTDPGRQIHRLAIRNLKTKEDVRCIIVLKSIQPTYLVFPSLLGGASQELDLGQCYFDRYDVSRNLLACKTDQSFFFEKAQSPTRPHFHSRSKTNRPTPCTSHARPI